MTVKQLPDFSSANILIYGDVMLDQYWSGDVTRVSPEAPVPVVAIDQLEHRAGGAANVALNIAALGAHVQLLGLTGQDRQADQLKEQLVAQGIQCFFQAIPDKPTITKLRVLGQHQQLIRMDFEKNFSGVDDKTLQDYYESQLNNIQLVLLSDYAKGALHRVQELILVARQKNIPIFIDPKSNDFSRYNGATLLTPNRKEFEAIVGECADRNEIESRAKALLSTLTIEALLITLGKDGMLFVPKEGESQHLAARAREVFDVTGAGDTVIGVLGAAAASGCSLKEAAELANIAAGIVVGKLGSASVTLPELRRAVQFQHSTHLGVLSEQELLMYISDARAHGETIVMTNGCFDLLHAGHVQYLDEAKKLGDRLIVAVNSDDSVRRLKGSERPLNALEHRMDVLAGLRAVDWVVSFSEDTPARLIEAVKPDVLVKGGDYRAEAVVGYDTVTAQGGRVEILPFLEGLSTTSIVEKIKQSDKENV